MQESRRFLQSNKSCSFIFEDSLKNEDQSITQANHTNNNFNLKIRVDWKSGT